jgi:hypothetical protein
MTAFRRFDPYALLAEDQKKPRTLASLADLAGLASGIANLADAPFEGNQDRGGNAAKVAKPAKIGGGKAGTLASLAAPALEIENPARWSEADEERAAIVEHDGKIPRAWAEGFARLDPYRSPGDVPLRRWQRFVDDVGIFLDRWAAYAAALGWGPYDLFGCDRDRPSARIDQCGLLWLLNGDKLFALTGDTATIERRTGARHTYRRKPSGPGQMLAWELT